MPVCLCVHITSAYVRDFVNSCECVLLNMIVNVDVCMTVSLSENKYV